MGKYGKSSINGKKPNFKFSGKPGQVKVGSHWGGYRMSVSLKYL